MTIICPIKLLPLNVGLYIQGQNVFSSSFVSKKAFVKGTYLHVTGAEAEERGSPLATFSTPPYCPAIDDKTSWRDGIFMFPILQTPLLRTLNRL